MVLRNVKLRSQLFNTLHAVYVITFIRKDDIKRCKIKNQKERKKKTANWGSPLRGLRSALDCTAF